MAKGIRATGKVTKPIAPENGKTNAEAARLLRTTRPVPTKKLTASNGSAASSVKGTKVAGSVKLKGSNI